MHGSDEHEHDDDKLLVGVGERGQELLYIYYEPLDFLAVFSRLPETFKVFRVSGRHSKSKSRRQWLAHFHVVRRPPFCSTLCQSHKDGVLSLKNGGDQVEDLAAHLVITMMKESA